jgi:hypothetical protein
LDDYLESLDKPADKEVASSGDAFSDTDLALAEIDLDSFQSPVKVRKSRSTRKRKANDSGAGSTRGGRGRRRSSLLLRKLNANGMPEKGGRGSVGLQAKVHEEKMAEAYKEAEEIQKQDNHFQPFGGLPDKVPQLFASLRGISDLYCEYHDLVSLSILLT